MRLIRSAAALVLFTAVSGLGCRDDNGFVRVNAMIRVEPATLEFNEVLLGSSKTLVLDVYNDGEDVLRICLDDTQATDCVETTKLLPANAAFEVAFDDASAEGWLVNKGSSRQLLVTFAPTVEGPAGSTLALAHNGQNGPTALVQMSATSVGPQVDLDLTSLDFGEVAVGDRAELELTFINKTDFDTPMSITLGQQDSVNFGIRGATGDLSHDQPFIGTIPGAGQLPIKVWFSPTEEGPVQNALAIAYCDGCGAAVDLVGTGIKPTFALDPGLVDFGTMADGQPASGTFTIRNTGMTRLTVESVELESGTTSEFSVVVPGTLPQTIDAGGMLPVAVSYVSVTPGLDQGRIRVETNAWNDPQTSDDESVGFVSLSAESIGPDIDPFPERVSFDAVGVGGSQSQGLVLANSGNAPLTINDMRLSAPQAEIRIEGLPSFPHQMAPGDSVLLTVIYAPENAGMDMVDLVVTSNDRDESPLNVPIRATGTVPNACAIAVVPPNVNFGIVEPGLTASLGVLVRAVGTQPCRANNFALSAGSEITMETPPTQVMLQPGEEHRLTLTYAPTANGSHSGTLSFMSDDPSQANVAVPITASAQPTDIRATPSALDFGVVPTSCRSPNRFLTVYNTGGTSETVTNVYLDPSTSPAFTLNPIATPLPLAAGSQALLSLMYQPTQSGTDLGVLFIEHSAATAPIAVPLEGESSNVATVTDTFQQNPTPADVLFVVDNSCSMMEEQANLGANLAAFLSFAQGQGVDYQIAVTTTDVDPGGQQGQFVGVNRIITPLTSNVSQIFQANVNVGIAGATVEQGLEAAYMALTAPNIAGHNAGFIRPHASLAVIFVSDEEDQSPRPLSFYQNFLANVKPNGNYTISAIAGTTNPECSSPDGIGDYAPRYITTAQSAGGVVESICSSNWGQSLTNIGLASFGLSATFDLSSTPVPNTISVTVNGTPAPTTTWSYDQNTNTITFAQGQVPAAYANVGITYTVQCL